MGPFRTPGLEAFKQHFLNFLPLPHGHDSFLPVFISLLSQSPAAGAAAASVTPPIPIALTISAGGVRYADDQHACWRSEQYLIDTIKLIGTAGWTRTTDLLIHSCVVSRSCRFRPIPLGAGSLKNLGAIDVFRFPLYLLGSKHILIKCLPGADPRSCDAQ